MSMNLTLYDLDQKCDVELWQTPTFITKMCLSWTDDMQGYDGGQEGVRKRYFFWLESHLNGVWKSKVDLEDVQDIVAAHKAKVLSVKNPRFSWD